MQIMSPFLLSNSHFPPFLQGFLFTPSLGLHALSTTETKYSLVSTVCSLKCRCTIHFHFAFQENKCQKHIPQVTEILAERSALYISSGLNPLSPKSDQTSNFSL